MRLLTLTVFLLSLSGCTNGLCKNEIITETYSPDNTAKAIIFVRDCGATTDFSSQVSIVENGDNLQGEVGNVFVADTNHGAASANDKGGPEVKIEWISNTELEISYHEKSRVFKEGENFKDIKIKYKRFK